MTLEVCCKSCYKTIRFQNSAEDRGILKKLEGEELGISCSSCGKKHKYHLNKITAIPNQLVSFIAILITAIAALLIFLKYGHILANPINNSFQDYNNLASCLLPLFVYYLFNAVIKRKCRIFNEYQI